MQTNLLELRKEVKQLQLFPHQIQAKKDTYSLIKEGIKKILIVSATGSGKTETACGIVQDALSKGRKIAFVVHRDNLARQTMARFEKYGLEPSAVHPDFPKQYDNPLQVVSIQTLSRRPDALHLLNDLTIYDEAHLTAWTTLGKKLLIENHSSFAIGLTATPWRLSKREEMGDLFSGLVLAPLPYQLINDGFLVPPRYFGLDGIDTKDVNPSMGDFSLEDLGVLTNDPNVVKLAVNEWERLAEKRKTIAFTVNIAHSKALADEFNKRGIPAVAIYGKSKDGDGLTPQQCEFHFNQLREGKITVITSCEKLAEGFDVPDIGVAMLCRPTKSKAKYVQQLGRALRIFPDKKDAIILDQAGNVTRHGFIEDFTKDDFQLTQSTDGEKGVMPTKECPCCGNEVRISLMICNGIIKDKNGQLVTCGYEFPVKEKIQQTSQLVELKVTFPEEKTLSQDLIEYRQWKREAWERRWNPRFAIVKYKERYGRWPAREGDLGAIFNGKATDGQKKAFREYLEKIALKKGWDENEIEKEWKKEFGVTSR